MSEVKGEGGEACHSDLVGYLAGKASGMDASGTVSASFHGHRYATYHTGG